MSVSLASSRDDSLHFVLLLWRETAKQGTINSNKVAIHMVRQCAMKEEEVKDNELTTTNPASEQTKSVLILLLAGFSGIQSIESGASL